jgi:hypothetical protein
MTPQEKTLYHQIHPLKLFTDISAEVLSLYLFWERKLLAGLVVLLVPPIIVSTLIIAWVDLEAYKQSAFGRYMRASMTPLVVAVRLYARAFLAALQLPAHLPAGVAGDLPRLLEAQHQDLHLLTLRRQYLWRGALAGPLVHSEVIGLICASVSSGAKWMCIWPVENV